MTTYKNPQNGHTETVGSGASIGVLSFGALYLAARGLWGHFVIWLLLVAIPAIASGGPLLLLSLPAVLIGYAIAIQGILSRRYLRNGWVRVDQNAAASIPDQTWYRKCPYCAEEVLAEAIKCKHCHSELEPIEVAPPAH